MASIFIIIIATSYSVSINLLTIIIEHKKGCKIHLILLAVVNIVIGDIGWITSIMHSNKSYRQLLTIAPELKLNHFYSIFCWNFYQYTDIIFIMWLSFPQRISIEP